MTSHSRSDAHKEMKNVDIVARSQPARVRRSQRSMVTSVMKVTRKMTSTFRWLDPWARHKMAIPGVEGIIRSLWLIMHDF